MLTSIILAVVVLGGIIFLLACLRGFHRAMAGEKLRIPVTRLASIQLAKNPPSGNRIIRFPKAETSVVAGKARSKKGHKIASMIVADMGI